MFFNITPWEEGISWLLSLSPINVDCQYYDEGNLKLSSFMDRPEWIETIPEEVLIAAKKFERVYKKYTMASLWLVSRNDFARERFIQDPLLFFLSVHYGVKKQLPAEQLFKLYSKKREYVFGWYQLPTEKRLVNFFKHYFTQNFDEERFNQLVKLMQNHGVKTVLQVKNIHRSFLNTLEANPALLDCPAFIRIQQQEEIKPTLMLISDIQMMAEKLLNNPWEKLQRCKTRAQLKNLQAFYMREIDRVHEEEIASNLFPVLPKFPSHPFIQRINHLPALKKEGEEMEHCVASYASQILDQKYFVFRILKPQRATLGVKKVKRKYVIDQLKLKNNEEPQTQTFAMVEKWLDHMNDIVYKGESINGKS